MIHLILDTTAYKADPKRVKPEFKALTFLGKRNIVCLHIPYIIKNEFLTHKFSEYESHIKKIETAIRDLERQRSTELLDKKLSHISNRISQINNIFEREISKILTL